MTDEQAGEMFRAAFERLVAVHTMSRAARSRRACWSCGVGAAQDMLGLCGSCADERAGLVGAQPGVAV